MTKEELTEAITAALKTVTAQLWEEYKTKLLELDEKRRKDAEDHESLLAERRQAQKLMERKKELKRLHDNPPVIKCPQCYARETVVSQYAPYYAPCGLCEGMGYIER